MRGLFIVIILLSAADAAAQERMSAAAEDSSRIILRGTPEFLGRPVTILPLTFALNVPQTNTMLPLYQSFAGVPQSFAWEQQRTVDLTAPLKLQLYQSETEKAVRITLGAAQLGGAAFLAYKYLKRNGFK
jgi:hypothetical protein